MIVPALLTDDINQLLTMAELCSTFTDYVQVDIMDGLFVPSQSVSSDDIRTWKPPLRCEAHLMVVDPLAWLEPFAAIGAERIIFHFEIDANHSQIIDAITTSGMKAGIAVNPGTAVSDFADLVPRLDTVLFMAVNPGFYGADFIPEVLDKMRSFRQEFADIAVGIDGGIKLSNALSAQQAGADYICVDSAILKSDNPRQAYEEFKRLVYA
jgi:ribulose-phosphate 3-epimerase